MVTNTTQQGEPKEFIIQPGQQLLLERKGSKLLLRTGNHQTSGVHINDTGIEISNRDTLVLRGDGRGTKLTIDSNATFIPQVSFETANPVVVDGSFTAMASSTQIAQVDITPVALTNMSGADKPKKTETIRDGTGKRVKIPIYELETDGKNITQGSMSGKVPNNSKILEYRNGRTKNFVAVETAGNARVDFINQQDGDEALFSMVGTEPMNTTTMRFMRARNNAVAQAGALLNIENADPKAQAFVVAKKRVGVNGSLEKGRVTMHDAGTVDTEVAAAIPLGSGQKGPITGVSTSSGASSKADSGPLQKPAEEALRTEVITRVDGYMRHTAQMLGMEPGNEYPMLNNEKTGKNTGAELGEAMRSSRDAAATLVNANTQKVRSGELAQLHESIDTVIEKSGAIFALVETDYIGHNPPGGGFPNRKTYVASRSRAILDQFTAIRDNMNKTESLRDPRLPAAVTTDKDTAGKGTSPDKAGNEEAKEQAMLDIRAELPVDQVSDHHRQSLLARLSEEALGSESSRERLAVVDAGMVTAKTTPAVSASEPGAKNIIKLA
ncbi:MAG: hypothetical protein AB7L92_01830 [Alphaproteobacteria bacterium]